MDGVNMFDTPTTYRAMRSEYVLLAAGSAYLLWRKRREVRWPVAAGLFFYNDTIGYVPGAIAYRRSPNRKISKLYYGAYNTMHSALTAVAVGAAWAKLVRPEWALLGIPLHIGVDRGLFGNFLKPYSVPFEPEPHPVWASVQGELGKPWEGFSADADAVSRDGKRPPAVAVAQVGG
ncbi:MAG: hypothetical protein ACJ768_25430 [Gaiellaceae bacterium]